MRKIVTGALAFAVLSSGLAYAAGHSDAISMRKNGMQIVGTSMGTLAGMAKGEAEFDAKAALAALKGMNYVANTFGDFFPEGSADGDTTASPKIWEDMDGFKAAIAKFESATAAGIAGAPQSQADLGALMGSIGGNCKECHEAFRVKK